VVVSCKEFRAKYPLILAKPHDGHSAKADEAIVDHKYDCDSCDNWSALSCETFQATMSLIFQGDRLNSEMLDRLDDHYSDCDACGVAIKLDCNSHTLVTSLLTNDHYEGFWPLVNVLSQHEEECSTCRDKSLEQSLQAEGGSKNGHPCVHLAWFSLHRCDQHADAFECPDTLLVQLEGGGYGLPIRDGGRAVSPISHCPWCGIATK
jgi:hypothetical protein